MTVSISEAVRNARLGASSLLEALIHEGFDAKTVLADEFGVAVFDSTEFGSDVDLDGMFSIDLARKLHAFPVSLDASQRLLVALNDPLDLDRVAEIQAITGYTVIPLACTVRQLDSWISTTLRRQTSASGAHFSSSSGSPIARLVDAVILSAIQVGASDIHLEPFERELIIRIRKDGVLHVVRRLSYRVAPEVISRVKVMASMDIAERRRPQDGGIRFSTDSRTWDLRVSALPTEHGQKIVMRILDRGSVSLNLESLGMSPEHRSIIDTYLARPHGMVLVTGPTGSGKTTTLYTLLNQMRSPEINICTIEDPVEYRLEGISQTAVNAMIGLNFSSALRTLLRQDPDVILVGEIRDSETADLAVRAALTGHLVLSTLHTNDAATAVARLIDMGVEPFLLASSLQLVVAQRLVRKICPESKENHGSDCPVCGGSGYAGRIGVYEFLPVDEAIREAIQRKESASFIRNLARQAGHEGIAADAAKKVHDNLTTWAEVAREVTE